MSKILFLARIPAARNPSLSQPRCDRRVICATAEKNPAMPQGPGRPGLLFSCRQRMTQEWPWSLFLRRRAGEWEYEGEYECSHVGVLTPQEFASQDEKVKQSWAKKILESEKWPEYTTMRARIYLRKQNKEITQEEVQATIILLRSRGSKKKKTRQNGWENKLTAGDILDAFVRGDEQINIIAMTCVNYDHYFARDLSAKSASPRMSRKTSSHSGRSSARTTHPTRTLTHGRRIPAHLQDTFSDDEEKGSVHNSGEDSEEN